jgi:hypothetical protein
MQGDTTVSESIILQWATPLVVAYNCLFVPDALHLNSSALQDVYTQQLPDVYKAMAVVQELSEYGVATNAIMGGFGCGINIGRVQVSNGNVLYPEVGIPPSEECRNALYIATTGNNKKPVAIVHLLLAGDRLIDNAAVKTYIQQFLQEKGYINSSIRLSSESGLMNALGIPAVQAGRITPFLQGVISHHAVSHELPYVMVIDPEILKRPMVNNLGSHFLHVSTRIPDVVRIISDLNRKSSFSFHVIEVPIHQPTRLSTYIYTDNDNTVDPTHTEDISEGAEHPSISIVSQQNVVAFQPPANIMLCNAR